MGFIYDIIYIFDTTLLIIVKIYLIKSLYRLIKDNSSFSFSQFKN